MVAAAPVNPVLAVHDLACARLAGLAFHVGAGEVVALLGPNGVGKSTVLRALAGLAAPAAGRVDARGPLRYLPQDYRASLLPWLSAADNIALFLPPDQPAAERAADVARAARAVGLPAPLPDRRGLRLSGGELQRIALARTLAGAPRLLLLDEPFAALDVGARIAARRAIAADARARGAAVLLVTHDLDDVFDIADRVLLLGPRGVAVELAVSEAAREPLRTALLALCGEARA